MKRRMVGIAFALSVAIACSSSPLTTEPVPEWLWNQIRDFERMGNNAPAFVARYDYHGQVVYYVAPRCCDIPSILYDSTGTVLCAPDGGITGRGDGRCPDFFAQRTNEKILWRARGAA